VVRASITGLNLTCVTFRILSLSLSTILFSLCWEKYKTCLQTPPRHSRNDSFYLLSCIIQVMPSKDWGIFFLSKSFQSIRIWNARGNFCSVLCLLFNCVHPQSSSCTYMHMVC
jgi:hypothetical protein